MVVAELFTAVTGLGGLIVRFANAFATDRLFVPIVLVAIMGVLITQLVQFIEYPAVEMAPAGTGAQRPIATRV